MQPSSFDWNQWEAPAQPGPASPAAVPIPRIGSVSPRIKVVDETLRDGLQNPSVVDPNIADKLEILHLLNAVGVDTCDVGLPGAGPRAFEDVTRLVREMVEQKLHIRPTCAGRTLVQDIKPMADVTTPISASGSLSWSSRYTGTIAASVKRPHMAPNSAIMQTTML